MNNTEDLIFRLRKRAEIRRQIPTRKSVINGEPDRIADLLDEAANALEGYSLPGKKVCVVYMDMGYNGLSYPLVAFSDIEKLFKFLDSNNSACLDYKILDLDNFEDINYDY